MTEQPTYQQPMPQVAPQINFTRTVIFKGGWIPLLAGENQPKALNRGLCGLTNHACCQSSPIRCLHG